MPNAIITILISLCIITLPIGVVLGIVFAIIATNEKDKLKKVKYLWVMGMSFLGPVAILFVILSLWGLIHIISATVGH